MPKIAYPVMSVAVIAVIAAAISHLTELDFVPTVLIVGGALIGNGLIATVEDDLPGGFNNPDGADTPKYVSAAFWAGRALMLIFVGGCVFVLVLWALD